MNRERTAPQQARGNTRWLRRRTNAWIGAPGPMLVLAALVALGSGEAAAAEGPKVKVSSAAELQAAVANPANAGATIVLAPNPDGYVLSPSGPTAGRLELQTDMELEAGKGMSGSVVIDASLLPVSSYQIGGPATGALRVGRGHNAVRGLTLRGAVNGAAFIEADLPPPFPFAETSVTIEHCTIEGNVRGIDLRLSGAAANGRTVRATISDSIVAGNTLGMGQGIRIAILQGVTGATVRVTLKGNSFTGNLAGMLAAANASSGNLISIDSKSNEYSGNGIGCNLVAAIATGSAQANDNALSFSSHNDDFEGNDLPTAAYPDVGAGVAALAADSAAAAAGAASRNSVRVDLRNARFSGNPVADVIAFGARGANGLVAGTDNEALIVFLGSTHDPVIDSTDSVPPEPTNHATIVQHP